MWKKWALIRLGTKILALVSPLVIATSAQIATADDMRSEEFRSHGALREVDSERFLGKVTQSPCQCVKYDYDDGSSIDFNAGHELSGLCTKNSRYAVCHHKQGKYAGQSEICPLTCVSLKELPKLSMVDENALYQAGFARELPRYRAQVPPAILASLTKAQPDWHPLLVRRMVEDYDRQMIFDSPAAIFFQMPMRQGGKAINGSLVLFGLLTGLKVQPQWAIFDSKTATLLFSGPTAFLFDTLGSFARVALYPTGPATGAPTGGLMLGVRYRFEQDAVPCCGPFSFNDVSKGPVLISEEDAKKILGDYPSPGTEIYYGEPIKPAQSAVLIGPSALSLMPMENSSQVTLLRQGATVQIFSRGGEGNQWYGVMSQGHVKGYLPMKVLKLSTKG